MSALKLAVSACLLLACIACTRPPVVQVVNDNGTFQITRNGEPYLINGAGIDGGDIVAFANYGGTSFRTWRTDDAQRELDEAQRLGLTVIMCIEIGRERHGFDYDDDEAVAAQLDFAREEVLKYKDHPALLAWMIGNEPNLFFKNPKVFDAVNDISRMIHEVDGNHPTTTAMAGFTAELADLLDVRAPDLDFVSIQFYGEIVHLPRYLKEIDYRKPLLVTEWGAIGHWEVEKTAWGAPIEQNSSQKADNYLKSYQVAIEPFPNQIMGSYVFLWGQKQERTPTWYGMFLEDGAKTEAVDVMQYIWTGSWPENRAPRMESTQLDDRTANDSIVISAGNTYVARVAASDPDDDTLRYVWEIMRESEATQEGGDKEEVPERLSGLIETEQGASVVVTAPSESGAYRLFVYVYDDQGSAGHANIPFRVE